MSQLDLFGSLHSEPLAAPVAHARSTDPDTSHQAAERANRTIKANVQKAIDAVWKHPGCTSRELAEFPDVDLDRYEIARRLPDAETLGEVRKGDKRKCKVAGTNAVTWFPGQG